MRLHGPLAGATARRGSVSTTAKVNPAVAENATVSFGDFRRQDARPSTVPSVSARTTPLYPLRAELEQSAAVRGGKMGSPRSHIPDAHGLHRFPSRRP